MNDKFIELSTKKYPIGLNYIKMKFNEVSFPKIPNYSILRELGYAKVHPSEVPFYNENTHYIKEGTPIYDIKLKLYIENYEVLAFSSEDIEAKLNSMKTKYFEKTHKEKNRLRDGGFLVDGVLYDSDQIARTSYQEFLTTANIKGEDFYSVWKASEGVWVKMTKELCYKVLDAGYNHLNTVYTWQAMKDQEIENCKSIDELLDVQITLNLSITE